MTNPTARFECPKTVLDIVGAHGMAPLTLITLATMGHFKDEPFDPDGFRERLIDLQQEDVAWEPSKKSISQVIGKLAGDPPLLEQYQKPPREEGHVNIRIKTHYQISRRGLARGTLPAVTILDWWMRNPQWQPERIIGGGGKSVVGFARLNLLNLISEAEEPISENGIRHIANTRDALIRIVDGFAEDNVLVARPNGEDRLLTATDKARMPIKNLLSDLTNLASPTAMETGMKMAEDLVVRPEHFSALMRLARLAVKR